MLLPFWLCFGNSYINTKDDALWAVLCAGHNDLQCGNVLMPCSTPSPWNQTTSSSSDASHCQAFTDAGSVKLIDYDYACWSSAGFDIANHW